MDLVGGGVDSRGGYVSKILYVKMKELGPLGGRAPGAPLDPPMKYIHISMKMHCSKHCWSTESKTLQHLQVVVAALQVKTIGGSILH